MHFSTLVIIDAPAEVSRKTVESAVAEAMQPYEGQFWDWYQVGGRWTGTLDGYDPETDPANIVTCKLCNGTGKRTDMVVADGCNGCKGTGKHVEWPTNWVPHGDWAPVESITQETLDKFHQFVFDDYGHFGGDEYMPWKPTGETLQDREKPPLEWLKTKGAGKLAVVVDCHN